MPYCLNAVTSLKRTLENYEFKYRQNNKNSNTFRHFRPFMNIRLKVQKSNLFSSETLLQIKSYQLLLWWHGEMKMVYRDMSNLLSTLEFFQHRDSYANNKIHHFSDEESFSSRDVLSSLLWKTSIPKLLRNMSSKTYMSPQKTFGFFFEC